MTSLYSIRYSALKDINKPDIQKWCQSSGFFGINSCLIDRTGVITQPLRMKIHKYCHMPSTSSSFKKTFSEVCLERARELLEIQNQSNKQLYILYSGGIDSTATLTAFLQILTERELRDRVVILMSQSSINENPNFYYKYIQKKLRTESSEKFTHLLNENTIVVNSLLCGWLFGPTQYIQVAAELYGFERLNKKINREMFENILYQSGHTKASAACWYDILVQQISDYKKVEVNSVYEFLWWFVFCFGWQSDYLKVSLRYLPQAEKKMTENFFDTQYFDFYSSENFQIWSMLNNDKKIRDTWSSFKWPAKEFIYEFNGDAQYLKTKVKVPSLSRLFHNSRLSNAMTDQYEFIDALNIDDYYVPNNSFK